MWRNLYSARHLNPKLHHTKTMRLYISSNIDGGGILGTSIDSSHLDEHMLVPPVSVRGDFGELLEGGPFRGLDSPRALWQGGKRGTLFAHIIW